MTVPKVSAITRVDYKYNKNLYLLPDPTGIKIPVFFLMISDWFLLIPLSHFGHFALDLPWFDKEAGTRHLVFEPLVHPKPRLNLWFEHIVQFWMSFGLAKIAARQRIKSTSSADSAKENRDLCVTISLSQENKGTIILSLVFSHFFSLCQSACSHSCLLQWLEKNS